MKRPPPKPGSKDLLIVGAATGVVVAIVWLLMWAVGLQFNAGMAMVDDETTPEGAVALLQSAADFRIAQTGHYFSWAALTIGICAGVVWRVPPARLTTAVRCFLAFAFALAGAGIVVGVEYVDLAAVALGHGVNVLGQQSFLDGYPTAQFALIMAGFLFAVLAVLSAILRPTGPRGDAS